MLNLDNFMFINGLIGLKNSFSNVLIFRFTFFYSVVYSIL
jgi:hypothetical protein